MLQGQLFLIKIARLSAAKACGCENLFKPHMGEPVAGLLFRARPSSRLQFA